MRKLSAHRNLLKSHKVLLLIAFIFLLGLYFRTFNVMWDNGFSFHPDERAIIMKVASITPPTQLALLASKDSPLNLQFYAYGNFPLYLLKILSFTLGFLLPHLGTYEGMYIVGRSISALFDSFTILLIFIIAKRMFNSKVALLSAFCYAVSVLPIQLSHFFAVDTILTTFMTAAFLAAIYYIEKPSLKYSVLLGILLGLSLATKISSLILLPLIGVAFIGVLIKTNKKQNKIKVFIHIMMCAIATVILFFLVQPYILVDWKNFLEQTSLQTQMSRDPFIFPYTLQFVGKLKYFYELKQIFFWGLGPTLGGFSLIGSVLLTILVIRKRSSAYLVAVLLFYLITYFLLFGSFAVGWVRYMLPIYPLLAICAGWLCWMVVSKISVNKKFIVGLIVIAIVIYPLSYLSIYTKPNPRISATDWILQNIPKSSKIAVEHWDDSLPIIGGQEYLQIVLPMYEPDTNAKWEQINQQLNDTEYIILASNRLSGPLQKLTDCENLPEGKCYPLTARYYKDLFSEKLGFTKIKEFTSYPTIPLINFPLDDQAAAEDFTVFDHPKIIIFRKNE